MAIKVCSYNDSKILILNMKHNEGMGSMSYDRTIYYYPFKGFPELLKFTDKDICMMEIKHVTTLPYKVIDKHTGYDVLSIDHCERINGEIIEDKSYTSYMASPEFNTEFLPEPNDPMKLVEKHRGEN